MQENKWGRYVYFNEIVNSIFFNADKYKEENKVWTIISLLR